MNEQRVLLYPAQVAELLGIKMAALSKWRCTAEGPRFCRVGARIRYDRADIDEWLDSRRRRSTYDTSIGDAKEARSGHKPSQRRTRGAR
jgi:predicted DNA-binding transcriptional regulator AlpA